MDRSDARTADPERQDAQQPDAAPHPSVVGDVEDAVTPQAEGELTPWMPPDQADDEEHPED